MTTFTFGLAVRSSSQRDTAMLAEFVRRLAEEMGTPVTSRRARSYDELAAGLTEGSIDFAWLPPVVFVGLEEKRVVTPLASLPRGGQSNFLAVMIARASSAIHSLDDIQGARAAWVDRWSSSGFLLPRLAIASRGLDPQLVFASEEFMGSHDAVVRAVVGGRADVGTTYANLDPFGRIAKGPWTRLVGGEEAVRVVARFGEVPGDVLGVRSELDGLQTAQLRAALLRLVSDPQGSGAVRRLFGVDDLQPWITENYEPLREALREAARLGFIQRPGDTDE
jgi:phosphonate transport system substrate-binding protein